MKHLLYIFKSELQIIIIIIIIIIIVIIIIRQWHFPWKKL